MAKHPQTQGAHVSGDPGEVVYGEDPGKWFWLWFSHGRLIRMTVVVVLTIVLISAVGWVLLPLPK